MEEEMAKLDEIRKIVQSEYTFLMSEHPHWSLKKGHQDLELVAHALRVLLHYGETSKHREEYLALSDCQHADGGWGRVSSDQESAPWVSAFCGLMLIRGNRHFNDPKIVRSVEMVIDYFLKIQEKDGAWKDPNWGDLDATSHPISLFNVVLACQNNFESKRIAPVREAWKKGIRFILDGQSEDGGWYDEHHPSGVETTAHLIQDALVADLVLDNEMAADKACRKGMERLFAWQSAEGSWDEENVDHTMDSTRSLMVVSRILGDDRARPVIEKGFQWILKVKNPKGWGDFPGMKTNLERTCDGLDTMLKYLAFHDDDPQAVVRRWGYAL
jgi:squalene cyclase